MPAVPWYWVVSDTATPRAARKSALARCSIGVLSSSLVSTLTAVVSSSGLTTTCSPRPPKLNNVGDQPWPHRPSRLPPSMSIEVRASTRAHTTCPEVKTAMTNARAYGESIDQDVDKAFAAGIDAPRPPCSDGRVVQKAPSTPPRRSSRGSRARGGPTVSF